MHPADEPRRIFVEDHVQTSSRDLALLDSSMLVSFGSLPGHADSFSVEPVQSGHLPIFFNAEPEIHQCICIDSDKHE